MSLGTAKKLAVNPGDEHIADWHRFANPDLIWRSRGRWRSPLEGGMCATARRVLPMAP